jgi:hypothetical protein
MQTINNAQSNRRINTIFMALLLKRNEHFPRKIPSFLGISASAGAVIQGNLPEIP